MMDTRVKPAYDDYPGDDAVSADMKVWSGMTFLRIVIPLYLFI